jgi:hypothetical protein
VINKLQLTSAAPVVVVVVVIVVAAANPPFRPAYGFSVLFHYCNSIIFHPCSDMRHLYSQALLTTHQPNTDSFICFKEVLA